MVIAVPAVAAVPVPAALVAGDFAAPSSSSDPQAVMPAPSASTSRPVVTNRREGSHRTVYGAPRGVG